MAEFHIFEKSDRLGTGLAYNDLALVPAHQLHFLASFTSILHSDPEDFIKWITATNKTIAPMSNMGLEHHAYQNNLPPRALFGEYLQSRLIYAQDQIRDFNAKAGNEQLKLILHENSEVINIIPSNGKNILEIAQQGHFETIFDYVVIATGHIQSHPSFLDKNIAKKAILASTNYLPDPWDSSKRIRGLIEL